MSRRALRSSAGGLLAMALSPLGFEKIMTPALQERHQQDDRHAGDVHPVRGGRARIDLELLHHPALLEARPPGATAELYGPDADLVAQHREREAGFRQAHPSIGRL